MYNALPDLLSFPTRRSSDLPFVELDPAPGRAGDRLERLGPVRRTNSVELDRKSTRLNSSHLGISYAVFCLKKKKVKPPRPARRDALFKFAQLLRRRDLQKHF